MTVKFLFNRLFAPAGDNGSDAGGGALPGNTPDLPGDGAPSTADLGGDGTETPGKGAAAAAGAGEGDGSDDDGDGEGDGDDGDSGAKGRGKDNRIPLSRHKAVLEKEREKNRQLEAQLRQQQATRQTQVTTEQLQRYQDDVDKKETAYQKALLEGDTAAAESLRREINQLNRAITNEEIRTATVQAESRAREAARYDITMERVEQAYPALNEDSDEFDAELAQDVMDKMVANVQRGQAPYEALQNAVKRVMGAPANRAQERATTDKPRVAGAAQTPPADAKLAAGKRAVDTIKRTPANIGRVGSNSDTAGGGLDASSVSKLSYEEFNKIPEDTLARLRGDFLV